MTEQSVIRESSEGLVLRARDGDPHAWHLLVLQYHGLVRSVICDMGLQDADAADVAQSTWLRLVEHIAQLTDPSRVGLWLLTTARREVYRHQARHRLVLVGDELEGLVDRGAPLTSLDERLLSEEQSAELRRAIAELPQSWQVLLAILLEDPLPTYQEVSTRLGVPVGSIGPTRGRCVRRLREMLMTSRPDAAPQATVSA